MISALVSSVILGVVVYFLTKWIMLVLSTIIVKGR